MFRGRSDCGLVELVIRRLRLREATCGYVKRSTYVTSSVASGPLGVRGVVDLVGPAGGEDGEIGADLGGLGLQEQMIVRRDEGEPFDVARPQTYEGLPGLELQIRLVADESHQPIDLIRAVGGAADPGIQEPGLGLRLGERRERRAGGLQRCDETLMASTPLPVAAASGAPLPAGFGSGTSASGLKSTILNPSGFQAAHPWGPMDGSA